MLKRARTGGQRGLGRRGVATLEFAAIAPVLVLMFVGVFDVSRALIVWQQVQTASEWISVSAESMAVQQDMTTTELTPTQAVTAMTAIYAAIPQLKSGLYGGAYGSVYGVALSGVEFTQDGNNTPYYAWTVNLNTLNAAETYSSLYDTTFKRACGTTVTPTQTVPQDRTILTTIPTKNLTTTPPTVAVADVYFEYVPLFTSFITGPIKFYASFSFPTLVGPSCQPLLYNEGAGDPNVCTPPAAAGTCANYPGAVQS